MWFFNITWEQRKLGEIYNFSKGKGLPLDSFYEGADRKAIAYGHLYTQYVEVINDVYLSSNDEGVMSKAGDILFPGSSTVPYGTAQSNAIMVDDVMLGGDIVIARKESKKNYAPFVSYQINAQKSKMFPICVGTTITHMYGKDLEELSYYFPQHVEQEKIAELFIALDNLITLHQRKLEKLKNVKKACLKKMFV